MNKIVYNYEFLILAKKKLKFEIDKFIPNAGSILYFKAKMHLKVNELNLAMLVDDPTYLGRSQESRF